MRHERKLSEPGVEPVTIRERIRSLVRNDELNFLLTNRIPRQLATRFVGWFSQIEQPLVRDVSIAAWCVFSDLELEDAATTDFRSMHDCFVRRLKPGARAIDADPSLVVSPCDGIVGAHGRVEDAQLFQAKGFPYALSDLLPDPALVERYRDGTYVTLRLTSAMYHRFHAPYDCRITRLTYIAGDTWNTNPVTLKRIEKLYCKNERAVLEATLRTGHAIALVPVAAILVASIRLHFVEPLLGPRYAGPQVIDCDASFTKGEELGFFQHGSTLLVFAPPGFSLCEQVRPDGIVRMGQALLRLPKP